MTKVDIFSGFLGAGKTTLIKKLIAEAYQGQKIVLIENEFGEIGIDGSFMADAGIQVNELNSGCICCSLVGDFAEALHKVVESYAPDRILIEPSGVGKLSDIIRAVSGVDGMCVNSATVVCDAGKCKMYMKNFGEFYDDQVKNAGAIVLSRTGAITQEKLDVAIELLRTCNADAAIITTPWDELDGKQILEAMEHADDTLEKTMKELLSQETDEDDDDDHDEHCHCHHHDDDEDEHDAHCHCHHHDGDEDDHDHDEHCHCHHHDDDEDEHDAHCHCHHHDDDDDHDEHEHHHNGHCSCGHHHHHHHHGDHDADEVFTSWGVETPRKYNEAEIKTILSALDTGDYGMILRAKGIIAASDGQWIHFDYVPGEADVRRGSAGVIGRMCVIGSDLKEDALKELFGL